jgi:RNA polymerase sigma-54 factor
MCATLALQTRQQLSLTPRLQESLRLLQMSSLELQQELRAALDTNPFLEEASLTDGESPSVMDAGAVDGSGDREAAPEEDGAGVEPAGLPTRDDSAFVYSGEVPDRGAVRYCGEAADSDPADWLRMQPTLREQLHDALCLCQLDGRGREAARIVIDALDDDGYLRQDLAELAAAVHSVSSLTESELLIALRLVQSLDKPGIGARSLSECLLLQLDATTADVPGRRLKKSPRITSNFSPAAKLLSFRNGWAAIRTRCMMPVRSCAGWIRGPATSTAARTTLTSCPT